MIEKVLDYFIATQSPWAILFTLLLGYTILTNARREEERRNELSELRKSMEDKLNTLLTNSQLQLETWKIMIERELERRKQE